MMQADVAMTPLSGRKVDARSVPTYTWNADLIYFDGPMLSLYKQDDGQDVLFAWLDCDDRKNRWSVFTIDRDQLRAYLLGDISLRSICLATHSVFVFDTGMDCKRRNWILLNRFPEEYLPAQSSYLKPEIATIAARRLVEDTPVDLVLGLNGELYLEDLEGIPKLYQQLYSFHYGMEHMDRPAVKHTVQKTMETWSGGIGAVNLFSGLKSVMPSIHRARLTELRYNSPGVIRLNLLPLMAEKILTAMDAIVCDDAFNAVEMLYKRIYDYFRAHKITGFDDENSSVQLELNDVQKKDLRYFIGEYFKHLGWDLYRERFSAVGMTEISQLRMLLAYYRRLRKLRKYVIAGKLKLDGKFPDDLTI
jgi:hypothetical protein